jgi:peroxiredoxin
MNKALAATAAAALLAGAAWLGWQSFAAAEPAPAVSYTLLGGHKGNTADLKGKVVLVNFWATSCATCVAEMPQIVATHNKFKARGYETIAVAMQYDPPAYVSRFAESRQLPFGVAIDNTGDIAKRFGDIKLTPTTFLIDKQGRIVKRYVGTPDFVALDGLIGNLLAQS